MSDMFEFIDAEYATRTTANARTPAPGVPHLIRTVSIKPI
ncbi:hypothetical protein FF86_109017 [Frankia sp. CpI1-P]|nr:hypothetical protein FF86_109017 [Frankia sp. CpI1-P]